MKFEKISYNDLNARQKENYNFHKVAAVLADYGFFSMKLSDDWNGADFVALHLNGETISVQLKSRLTVDKKYLGKNLWVGFIEDGRIYLYSHDEVANHWVPMFIDTKSWKEDGLYHVAPMGKEIRKFMEQYRIGD